MLHLHLKLDNTKGKEVVTRFFITSKYNGEELKSLDGHKEAVCAIALPYMHILDTHRVS